jgi:hypothetical protein
MEHIQEINESMNEYSGNVSSYAEDNLKAYSDLHKEDGQYGIALDT